MPRDSLNANKRSAWQAVGVIAMQVAMIRESDNAITSDLAGGHRWRMRRSCAACPFWVGVALARDTDQNAVRG